MAKGLIFDIKRYAIHDGPGIRTTVFLKGCPLSCLWCHNPESLSASPHILYLMDRCIGCGECVKTCPQNALTLSAGGIQSHSFLCRKCGACADVCPAGARELAGRKEDVERLVEIIEKDVPFYDESGGGVTFSGGEPFCQSGFLMDLLDACESRGVHRAVDTSGFAPANVLLAAAEKTDLFLYDLKVMDPVKHLKYIGVSNEKVLDNLRRLAATGAEIIVRIPLIPGINDDADNIERSGAFISALPGVRNVSILPFHDAALGKYRRFGLAYRVSGIVEPTEKQLADIVKRLKKFDLEVDIGG